MTTRPSRLDPSQLARAIVDEATGAAPLTQPPPVKNPAAVALGRLGGKKGGAARKAALTPEQLQDIARKAAAARWRKS
jgi:hypothetical protein